MTPTSAASASGASAPSSAATGATVPGVTSNSITIGVSAPFSSAYGALIKETIANGFDVWASQVNAQGGINGRKIILKDIDNVGTTDGAVSACKESQTDDTFLTVIINSQNSGNAEPDCLDQHAIPAVYAVSTYPINPAWKYIRVVNEMPDTGAVLAAFVKNQVKVGSEKLGALYISSEADWVATYQSGLQKLGLTLTDKELIETSGASFTAQLEHLKNEGVQNVAIFAGVEVIGILRDAKALGYTPNWTGTAWAVDDYVPDPEESTHGSDQHPGNRHGRLSRVPAVPGHGDPGGRQGRQPGLLLDLWVWADRGQGARGGRHEPHPGQPRGRFQSDQRLRHPGRRSGHLDRRSHRRCAGAIPERVLQRRLDLEGPWPGQHHLLKVR